MKRLITAATAALSLALAACDNPPLPAYQAHDMPSQVTVTDWWLQQDMRVSQVTPERVGAGQLKVTVQVYNTTDHDLTLDYKYWFTDKNGTAIEKDTGWQFFRVAPRGFETYSFTSIGAVDDFRVQMRKAQ